MSRLLPSSSLLQLLIAGTALAGFLALSGGIIQAQLLPNSQGATMVLEHESPMDLYVKFSKHISGKGILLVSHNAQQSVHLSVPQSWKRTEVRNVPLQSVVGEEPQMGFVRWVLPPNASVSFSVPVAPPSLLLENPSLQTVKVEVTRVDLEQNTSTFDIVLVQNAPGKLW